MTEITIPPMGESITSGYLAAWMKKEGDLVSLGEDLLEVETDKATLAVPSPGMGILKILTAEGEEIAIGQTVGRIEPAPEGSVPPGAENPQKAASLGNSEKAAGELPPMPPLSPAVRNLAAEHHLDPASLKGSGKGGRLTKGDVLASLGDGEAKPSGEDVRKKMSPIRRTIAANLVASQKESAHLTTFNEVDMTEVNLLRERYKEIFLEEKGVKLGFMGIFVSAVCLALGEYPLLNGRIEGEEMVIPRDRNIGVAVSTEKGLITPVIRRANGMTLEEIEKTIAGFVRRAREKKLLPEELSGGTFTVSNGGIFGSLLSTPIPVPGQSGVLGMHSVQKRAVVSGEAIVIRPMMYLALTYDHRLVDGREAVGFLNTVKRAVEDPRRLLLGVTHG